MKNRYFIVILLVLLQLSVFAKPKISNLELPKWINTNYTDSVYPDSMFFLQRVKHTGIKPREKDEKKEALIRDLKRQLTERIFTSVTSSSVMSRNESHSNGYLENFSSETVIFSDINLFDSKPETFYNKNSKTLYGLLTVNKNELGHKYIKSIKNKLKTLKLELSSYNTNTSAKKIQNDIGNFNSRIKSIENQSQIIIATGVKIPDNFSELFAELRLKINELYKTLNTAEIEEYISKAQRFYISKQYVKALEVYKIAKIKLPHDERVVNGIFESEQQIEQQYLNQVNNYSNSGKFDLALAKYEALFNILPATKDKYKKEYNRLVEKSFDLYADKLEYALNNMTIPDIELALNQLRKYQHVDRDKFNRYKVKVDKAKSNNLYKQAKIKYNDKSYHLAINTINKAILIDAKNSNYTDLKRKAQHKLYQIDLKELKNTRPFLYAIQWGVGGQTQNNLLNEYLQTEKWNFKYLPSVTVGLYRKFGIKENVLSSGNDRSRTNIIGLKYTHLFQQVYYSTNNQFIKTDMVGLNEFEFVIGMKTKYLFNVGITTYGINTDFMKNSVDMISASLVRRFYMHPVELQFEIKTYVDIDMNFYPLLKINLLINNNFIRQVNRRDKTKLKYDIEN